MSSGPLISICIPAYNSEHFIGSTLESVLHQTCSNFEVIVADDHSTDRTISVVKKFGDRRIRLFKRDVLSKSGMVHPANPYMIDLAFWADLLKHGDAFMEQRRLAAFRISANSVSAKLGLKQAAYDRSFFRKMRADPFYRATLPDVVSGYFFAFPRCILRNFLIKLRAGAKGKN